MYDSLLQLSYGLNSRDHMADKSNWSFISKQDYSSTTKGRDVYEAQQMERSELRHKQTFFSRFIIMLVAGIFSSVLFYMVWAFLVPAFRGAPDVWNGPEEVAESQGTQEQASEAEALPEGGAQELSIDDIIMQNGISDNGEQTVTEEMTEFRFFSDRLKSGMYSFEDVYQDDKLDHVDIIDSNGELVACRYDYDDGYQTIEVMGESGRPVTREVTHNGEVVRVDHMTDDDTGDVYLKEYYSGGILIRTEDFENGQITFKSVYDKSGAIRIMTSYTGGEARKVDYYDTEGNITDTKEIHSFYYPRSKNHLRFSILFGLLVMIFMYPFMIRDLQSQNVLADTSEINQYKNDQHIQIPQEIQGGYEFFPDVGAISDVCVSSLISHMAMSNKGVNKIKVSQRYKKDVVDEDGQVVYYAGEPIRDEYDEILTEEVPMFDIAFMEDLFTASGIPEGREGKGSRIYYDPSKIPYNPGNKNRDRLKGKEDSTKLYDRFIASLFHKDIKKVSKFDTLADLINKDWEVPWYEPQVPGGCYIVDVAPVNTMVLAITRAGKGDLALLVG